MFSYMCATNAQEVFFSHQGFKLNAYLEYSGDESKAMEQVLLIVHGGLAHRDMESLRYLRSLAKDRQLTTLAINLSLVIDNRHGMYDCANPHYHTNDDAVEEIGIWVNWLVKQGANRIVLLGHSRGGAQAALYAVEHASPILHRLILMAPATKDNGAPAYERRYQQALKPLLDEARELVNAGNGKSLLPHSNVMLCRDTAVSAATFVSYYGEVDRLDTPFLLNKINVPTLVVVAGDDQVVIGLEQKLSNHQNKNHQIAVIDGADHFFRDLNMDEAMEVIAEFLVQKIQVSQ